MFCQGFFKRITASLISGLMLFGSTYSVLGSISSASNEIQPRGIYHVYGDVNNDGLISLIDLVTINKTIQKFNDFHFFYRFENTIMKISSYLWCNIIWIKIKNSNISYYIYSFIKLFIIKKVCFIFFLFVTILMRTKLILIL